MREDGCLVRAVRRAGEKIGATRRRLAPKPAPVWRCSAAWSAHSLRERGVASSNLAISTNVTVEGAGIPYSAFNRDLAGSSPVGDTNRVRGPNGEPPALGAGDSEFDSRLAHHL